jgi:phage repressor protein C with HTH and peptisase S24 domain
VNRPETFSGRIGIALNRADMDEEDLERESGVNQRTLKRYLEREDPPESGRSVPTVQSVADSLGVTVSWLRTGEGEMLAPAAGDGAREARTERPASSEDGAGEEAPVDDDEGSQMVAATLFGEASAESGTAVLLPHEPRVTYVSKARWEADFGPNVPCGADGYGYWVVRGDSAAPHYFEGERVPVELVPEPTQDFRAEDVYIFHWNGHAYLKRLFQSSGGVYAQSLNPSVRDMRFEPKSGYDFAVLARVRRSVKQQLYVSLLGSKLEPNR